MNQVSKAVLAPGPKPWRRVMRVIPIGLMFVLSVVFTLAVQSRGEREDEQIRHEQDLRWCRIVMMLDDAYRANPPTTDLGRDLAVEYRQLRAALGCDRPA